MLLFLLLLLTFSSALKSKYVIMQAGCTVKTGYQVLFVVKNLDDINKEEGTICKKSRRRWLVYFNATDYVASDFVILSGTKEYPSFEKLI